MKKSAFLLLLLFFISNSFSGDKSWYKVFEGNIGSYPVTVHMVLYGENIRGYYYYNKYKKPMEFFGTLKNDSLELDSYYSYDYSEIFKGIYKSNSYSGVWIDTEDESNKLDFKLTSNASSGFDFVYVEGSERLFKDLETPQATYMEGTVWPIDKYENALFIRNSILKLMDMRSGLTEIGGLMLENKKKYMKEFRDQNADVKKDEVADGGWSYSLDWNEVISPVYEDENIFVLGSYNYTYTGGAHGNYGTGFTNLDLKRKRIIKLSDILTSAGIKALPKLLEKNYKLQNKVSPEKSLMEAGLFVDTIPVNDNFIITPGTLMFNYVPYEIASYADGEVKIYIPYNEISAYIKPDAKEFFK